MKINWFSPIPPAKTGIAQYTADLLPVLCSMAEVTVWTAQQDWDRDIEASAPVRQFTPEQLAPEEVNCADVSFFSVGNDARFHLDIWQASRSNPGIVILHDVRLFEFFAHVYRERWDDRDGHATEVERYYGLPGRLDVNRWWDGQASTTYMVERYPLTPLAVEHALAGVVHTEEALRIAASSGRPRLLLSRLPCRPASQAKESLAAAEQRADAPPYRLIVFGYVGANRRLDSILRALAGLPEQERFVLDIYGELWDPDRVRSEIRALGIGDRVVLHGFVTNDELNAALDRAHLAVNLRYPTMGEASLSQLQVWDHALPSLVTPVGWYADLPPSAVGFVRPEAEVPDLQQHLRALLASPERFVAMGRKGRQILEQDHSPERYANDLLRLAEEVRHLRRETSAHELASRAGFEMAAWTSPLHEEPQFRHIAEQIRSVFA